MSKTRNPTTHVSEGDGSLNPIFEAVPISSFPTPSSGKIIVINSDMLLLDAVKVLSQNEILAAPVRDVSQSADASWSDKYLGFIDMVGIVFEMFDKLAPEGVEPTDFQSELANQEVLRHTTVLEATKWPRFMPFIPVDVSNGSMLDCMLLCGLHGIRRVPVVKSPGTDIVNVITQSALIQTLAANLSRFTSVAKLPLSAVGLADPLTVHSVNLREPLKKAFILIKDKEVSGVPVCNDSGAVVGNISARDVRYIINSSKLYKLLNMPIESYLDVVCDGKANSAITCYADATVESVIVRFVESRIHRIFVVDSMHRPIRVISLRDVIMRFVKEPANYFGHFFN